MKIEEFETNDTAETEGVWFDAEDNYMLEDARVKVARSNNRLMAAAMRKTMAKHARLWDRSDDAAEAKKQQIADEAMAEFILKDWENMEMGGKPVKFSREAALKALSFKDFRVMIEGFAASVDRYRVDAVEEASKNSQKS